MRLIPSRDHLMLLGVFTLTNIIINIMESERRKPDSSVKTQTMFGRHQDW